MGREQVGWRGGRQKRGWLVRVVIVWDRGGSREGRRVEGCSMGLARHVRKKWQPACLPASSAGGAMQSSVWVSGSAVAARLDQRDRGIYR